MINSKILKSTLITLVLVSSTGLTACGKKLTTPIAPMPATTAPSIDDLPAPDYSYDERDTYSAPVQQATPNAQVGSFLVDQALLNQWQARGIAVSGGSVYVTAADTSGLSKKGTVIKMNSSDGKGWKDLASKYLGISHPIDATVEGIAINGGNIIAVDSAGKIYSVDASNGSVKTLKTGGGKDIAAGAGSIFIANGTVEKTDSSASSRMPFQGIPSVSGGVGADNMGNVYAVSGTTIKKGDPSGMATDIITTDLTMPIDVAVDSRAGDIYVLDSNMIKRFNSNGQILTTFSCGASKPVGIAVDEAGAVYIADAGTSHKDSKVIKFAAALTDSTNMGTNSGYNSGYDSGYNYGSSTSGDYSTYSSTKKTTSTNPRKPQ